MQKLTLQEMSERLRVSPRTFRKYIKQYRIPYIKLGRCLVFDPARVELHLEAMSEQTPAIEPKRTRRRVRSFSDQPKNNKYAEVLGL